MLTDRFQVCRGACFIRILCTSIKTLWECLVEVICFRQPIVGSKELDSRTPFTRAKKSATPRLPVPRLLPGGSLGTPKILSTGATFHLRPIRLYVENWECRALKSSARCQKFGVPCRFFSACEWRLGLFLSKLRAVSLISWQVEQISQDTQMTTRVTEGARRERHAYCLFFSVFFLLYFPNLWT